MALKVSTEVKGDVIKISLEGELDASVSQIFKEAVEKAAQQRPKRLILLAGKLGFMASAGLRVLIFAKQKMGADVEIYVGGINGGTAQGVTGAVNFYLSSNTRIQANYSWMHRGFSPTDLLGRVNGDLTAFGIRFNCDF